MKYIKYFEGYESSLSSLKRESDDIFLPLRTEGHFLIATGDIMGGDFNVWITKGINNDKFKYSDVESYLDHFLGYAKTEGYVISIISITRNTYEPPIRLGDLYQLNNYDSLYSINIHLKNNIQKNEHNSSIKSFGESYSKLQPKTYFYDGRTSDLSRAEMKETIQIIADSLIFIFDEFKIKWEFNGNFEYNSWGKQLSDLGVLLTCIDIHKVEKEDLSKLISEILDVKEAIEERTNQKLILRIHIPSKIYYYPSISITTREINDVHATSGELIEKSSDIENGIYFYSE